MHFTTDFASIFPTLQGTFIGKKKQIQFDRVTNGIALNICLVFRFVSCCFVFVYLCVCVCFFMKRVNKFKWLMDWFDKIIVEYRLLFVLVGRNSSIGEILVASLSFFNYLDPGSEHWWKEVSGTGNLKTNAIYQTNQWMLRLDIHDVRLSLWQIELIGVFIFKST